MVAISRRILLQLAAVGSTAAFLIPEASAQGDVVSSDLPFVEITPGAIENYLKETQHKGMARFTEIQTEYRNATTIFPLTLPDGWTFPADCGLSDTSPGAFWERGMGASAAYFNWQRAVAAAAYAGHRQGDTTSAKRYLDLLEAGYATDVRRAALSDPEDIFTGGHSGQTKGGPLVAARNGDFKLLQHFTDPH